MPEQSWVRQPPPYSAESEAASRGANMTNEAAQLCFVGPNCRSENPSGKRSADDGARALRRRGNTTLTPEILKADRGAASGERGQDTHARSSS